MRHKRTGPIGPRLDRVRERINGADGERKTIERVRTPSNQQPRTTPGLVRGFRDASKTLGITALSRLSLLDSLTECGRAPDVVVWRCLSIIFAPAISDSLLVARAPRESGLLGGTLVRGCLGQNLFAAFVCVRSSSSGHRFRPSLF